MCQKIEVEARKHQIKIFNIETECKYTISEIVMWHHVMKEDLDHWKTSWVVKNVACYYSSTNQGKGYLINVYFLVGLPGYRPKKGKVHCAIIIDHTIP